MSTLFDFIFLAAGVFTIYLGIMVTMRGGHQPIHRTFTFFALNLGLWLVCLALLDQTQDQVFEKISTVFAVMGILSLPIFLYAFPRHSWPPGWAFWLLYIPGIPLILLAPTNLFIASLKFDNGLIKPNLGEWFMPLVALVMAYMLLTMVLYLIRFYTNKGNDRVRLQYIGAGLIVFLLMTTVGTVILPSLGSYEYLLTAPMSALLVFLTLATLAVIQQDLVDVRIIITEVFVFLAAGLVLLNSLISSTGPIELMTTGFILATFLFTAWRLAAMIMNILKQRRALNTANVKLKELMDMKTEFLQIASHQLRAPLTSLHGLVQMEATGYFDDIAPDKRDGFRKEMLVSVERLHELVNDLLKTLRLEGEKLPLKFADVDLVKLINDAITTLKPNYDKHGLYLKFEPRGSVPSIQGDAEYLRQIFMNLIDNAEHYTPNGGVTINIRQDASAIVIEIKDTGIGITSDEMTKMGQKFSRGPRAQQLRNEGTGLGLFIVRKIAEGHGGCLELVSAGENKGTTAIVKLPIAQPKLAPVSMSPASDTTTTPVPVSA